MCSHLIFTRAIVVTRRQTKPGADKCGDENRNRGKTHLPGQHLKNSKTVKTLKKKNVGKNGGKHFFN